MVPSQKPVIVYGGSFDPPHKGHMALAAAALRQLHPGALYFVPGWRTPFKRVQPANFRERRSMLKIALRAAGLAVRPEVKISDFEYARRRVVYTVETLEYFKKLHPGAPLYFLMGSDCLAGFTTWRRWRGILKKATLLVGMRPGHALPAADEVPVIRLSGNFPQAASTAVRGALYLGKATLAVVAPVHAYIRKKGLYLARERRYLKKTLSPVRFRHSLSVAGLALELAQDLGISDYQAAAAGLLHDCARELPVSVLLPEAQKFSRRPPGKTTGDIYCRDMVNKAPVLLHAWAGAERARRLFGITDPEILEAIALHATGAPQLRSLARLIYVCDLAAPGREFKTAALIRRLARVDFSAAFRAANYVKLSYAFAGGGWVHPLSVSLWNSLQEK